MSSLITALITPFNDDGSLDEEGFYTLLSRQVKANVDGIVVLGTTGETPTLSDHEAMRVIQIAVEVVKGKVKIYVGTGSNSTQKTIATTRRAAALGADGALVVTPYYNKPTQPGLLAHFKAIADSSEIPIILYDHPGRCGTALGIDTLRALLPHPNIIGLKEASGDMQRVSALISAIPELPIYSADDAQTLPIRALGGAGVISVMGNLDPEGMRKLCHLPLEEARQVHYDLLPLFLACGIETNPIPIKALMRHAKLPSGPCRLPLCGPSEEHDTMLRTLIEKRSLTHGAAQSQPC